MIKWQVEFESGMVVEFKCDSAAEFDACRIAMDCWGDLTDVPKKCRIMG